VLTTLCDPDQARADELAAAYHQRWEEETGNDQLKRLPRLKRMLGRSADLRCRDRKVLSDVGEVRYFVHAAPVGQMTYNTCWRQPLDLLDCPLLAVRQGTGHAPTLGSHEATLRT
jgi:hypothetical protein